MSSIVIELQTEALNSNKKIIDLLRKALVVSRKLGLADFKVWIEKEMNGYKPSDETPEYRMIRGQVRAFNPYQGGWIPLNFENPKYGEAISKRLAHQSVAELEDLLANNKSDFLQMPYPLEMLNQIKKGMNYEADVTLFVSPTSVVKILNAVRTIILNWTLKLEEDNILGEGMTFTTEEKRQASSTTYNNINNFFGNVADAQIQQGTSHSSQKITKNELDLKMVGKFVEMLLSAMPSLALGNDLQNELLAEITTIKAQLASPKPKEPIIKSGLETVFDIMKHATGHVAAELILNFNQYFPTIRASIGI